MKTVIYVLSLFFSIATFAQENSVLFEQGNTLYNNGDYENAISKYESVLDNEEHSAALYFNLANAHYKLNHIAPSIYYYEKALQLSPNDKDILNNLALAKNMTIDDIDVLPEVGFSKLLKDTSKRFSFDSWATLSVVLMLSFVFLFLNYYLSHNTSRKRMSFVFSSLCLLLMLVSIAFAFHNYNLVKKDNPAIVFAQESQVKSEPNLRSDEAFVLHEGTKVQVINSVNDWKEIKLSDGKTGWVINRDVKLLNKR